MTVARQNARRLFLEASGFGRCKPVLLAGDASNRRYERLHEPAGGKTYVLMDAPPEKGEDTRPFTHIAQHLLGCGLSAPEILAADHHNGFLVLEDFGDALFSSLLRESPAREQPQALQGRPPLSAASVPGDLRPPPHGHRVVACPLLRSVSGLSCSSDPSRSASEAGKATSNAWKNSVRCFVKPSPTVFRMTGLSAYMSAEGSTARPSPCSPPKRRKPAANHLPLR